MASMKQRARRAQSRGNLGPSNIVLEAAVVDLQAGQETSIPTFSAVAYSGGKLFVSGFRYPVIVDLSRLEASTERMSVLLDHKPDRRVGHLESLTVSNNQVLAQGVISAKTEHATEVVESARQGFRWHVSIGARIVEAYEVGDDQYVFVNGRRHQGPVIVASKARLHEISFVGVGGDEANSVSIAAAHEEQGASDMDYEKWVTDLGFDPTKLTDAQNKALKASYEAAQEIDEKESEVKPSTEDVADPQSAVKELRAMAVAESKRIAMIHKTCHQWPDLEAQAIEQGWDATKSELEAMRKERETAKETKGTQVAILDGQALEAALCLQLGLPEEKLAKQFGERVMNEAVGRKYRTIGLHSLVYRSLAATGRHYQPGRVDDETVMDFLRAERELQAAGTAAGGFSYLSTTGILGSTANKLLLDAFLAVGTTVPVLFGKRSVSDFKAHTAYRLAANGELEEVGPGGEIKHADLEEWSYAMQARTWGKMLTLTRTDIINDDLGAFEQIPRILGRKAAVKLEKEGWKLVLSMSSPFFSTDNSDTGSDTVLGIEGLTNGEKLMMNLVDTGGDPIMVSPKYLVTGTAIAATAQTLMGEARIIATEMLNTGGADKQAPALNPHAGKWQPIATPWINAMGLAGASATLWFLWADPADLPPFVVSYLNGKSEPTIESSDVSFERLGLSWRVVFDFGVDDAERLGCVKMAGA